MSAITVPRQQAASFTIDQAIAKLEAVLTAAVTSLTRARSAVLPAWEVLPGGCVPI